jgi:hypothetical protein
VRLATGSDVEGRFAAWKGIFQSFVDKGFLNFVSVIHREKAISLAMHEQGEQQNDWQWNADQPSNIPRPKPICFSF